MSKKYTLTSLVVWVAALGYFVDIFDLLLFGMIRTSSLKDIGITAKEDIERMGLMLDNWQMIGMLVGGIFWGILGDKKGRLSVLFGSILTYSIANIGNGFVHDVYLYALLRFVAGFGLAGELGAGVTLVNELLDKEKRGIGTALVAGTGILGAVVGGFVVKWVGDWRICYFIGGGMGIMLLLLRVGIMESGMFETMKQSQAQKGGFRLIFSNKKRLMKYLGVVFVAVPLWYVVQLYAKYSPELADAMGLHFSDADRKSVPVNAIMLTYLGLTFGDFACGLLSQYMRSRKKAIWLFMLTTIVVIIAFFILAPKSVFLFYTGICVLGFSVGYWAVFMSVAAESFGTNIRSTVTNTAPNFVRGTVVLVNLGYEFLKYRLHYNSVQANITVGIIVFALAIWALTRLEETFGKDLNYIEE
ncbi:Predicted arabinose efflux permease, MFS family [Filimonas lacunae]|uniref:Predicted arabinose efflux permease, MFS family n=1 Tax=Filimonas lacunae TaxID=477680 RepID=A0A173MMB4_9BACT|nr:MFS transporter [Filimonas lacunae]BAV08626.1 major facilitator superfamily (MFS) transport protein [Filimonas lacunae]SIS58741.1 Predicted arabinose efflux permease, MFS family [Filimonas lacunae]